MISLFFLSSLFFRSIHGQDCSDYDGDQTACEADTDCWYLGPEVGDLCRLRATCESDCTLCTDAVTCTSDGAGGLSLCTWSTFSLRCYGNSCATNCEECSFETECLASYAPPNRCFHGGLVAEDCRFNNETTTTTTTTETPTTTSLITTTEEATTDSPIITTSTECPLCPFDISLISIGNITIGACPPEPDCDCEEGVTAFEVAYINSDLDADSIAFYYNWAKTKTACPQATDVTALDEVVCTLDVANEDRFKWKTWFTIEYSDGTTCDGYLYTSCYNVELGAFDESCGDLVVTSWTDIDGGVCVGNVSLEEPTVTDASSSSSSSSSVELKWKHKAASEDSSDRRRLISVSSSSGSGSGSYTESTTWFQNKLCIPNCADWGAARGLDCGCYESCTADALNSSCYEGTTAGYCGTGVCCCGGECSSNACDYGSSSISSSSDSNRRLLGSERCSASSDSSDSVNGYYSYAEWYQDKCSITEIETGSGSSDSESSGRRRQLVGQSFGSARRLQSSSGSSSSASSGYNSQYTIITSNDYVNEFLIETCVLYQIDVNGTIPDCILGLVIFLPLCENNYTDFNTSNLNASDITGLITEDTFLSGTNVASAKGAVIDGQLGILIELESLDVTTFEICLGNVTVNAENVDTLNLTTIDTSTGIAYVESTDGISECPIDGLPCFNFFFDAECPPNSTDSIYRSCECVDGMVSMDVMYVGTESVTVLWTRKASQRGYVYGEYDVTEGDIMTVDVGEKLNFKWQTGVAITDASGDILCEGTVKRCSEDMIGSTVDGCEDLMVLSWTAGDGALCDEISGSGSGSSSSDSDSASSENLLYMDRETLNGALQVLEEMDPFIRYSLIAILVAFAGLMIFASYLCFMRVPKDEKKGVETPVNEALKVDRKRKGTDFSEYGMTQSYAKNITVEMST